MTGRAGPCANGIVIDLSGMKAYRAARTASRVFGRRPAADLAATDPLGLVAVTGSCSAVGMAGLTLGGGYGSLVGRFGLALDNLFAAEIVLADGSSSWPTMPERGSVLGPAWGRGNFGVVFRHVPPLACTCQRPFWNSCLSIL